MCYIIFAIFAMGHGMLMWWMFIPNQVQFHFGSHFLKYKFFQFFQSQVRRFFSTIAKLWWCTENTLRNYWTENRNQCNCRNVWFVYLNIVISEFWWTCFHFRCDIDNKNLVPFQLELIIGFCFVTIATLSGFYLKNIQPKMLVCKEIDSINQSKSWFIYNCK